MTATSSLQNGSDPVLDASHGDGGAPGGADEPVPRVESDLYGQFVALLPKVRSEIGELDARRDAINAERQERVAAVNEMYQGRLAEIDAERKRLNSLLRALGEEPEEPPAKRRATGAAKNERNVSAKVLAPVMEAIAAQGSAKFSALGIHEQLNGSWSVPQTYNAFNYLRAREYIGKAGKEDRPQGRTLFRILDHQVGIVIRAEVAAELDSGIRPIPMARPADESPDMPMPETIARYLQAIEDKKDEAFTTADIQLALGLSEKPSKTSTKVFAYLVSTGYLENLGKEPGRKPQHARTLYRVADENAPAELNLIEGEAHGA